MASPSESEVQTQWKNAVKLLEETRKFGNVNASNWVSLEDTLYQSVESDYGAEITGAIAQARNSLQAAITRDSAQRVIRPHFKSYIKHIVGKAVPTGDNEAIDLLYRWMFENTVTVKSRGFTFNSPAAGGSNIGNVSILRVTKDENNYDLEAATAEAKEARCISDRNTGSGLDGEIFRFRGAPQGRDALLVSGSGGTVDIRAASWLSSILRNTSFEDYTGSAISSPTAITDWTSDITVSGNYELDETNYYRAQQNVTTPRSLKIKATAVLSQKLSTFNTKIDPLRPYYLQIAWNREVGTASGTLLIRLGAQSNSVVAAAQTGWQILKCPSSLGQNCWYKNFDEQDLDITIEWTKTSGNILVDDVILVPFSLFDGTWYLVVANNTSHVPARKDDLYTWTDTIATDSVLQYWVWRAFQRYLPHSGAPSITDP